jgi:hypothetical protein
VDHKAELGTSGNRLILHCCWLVYLTTFIKCLGYITVQGYDVFKWRIGNNVEGSGRSLFNIFLNLPEETIFCMHLTA